MSWTVIVGPAEADEREQHVRTGYQEHLPDLYQYVCRLLGGDRHRAEDIIQETLLRCWLKYNERSGHLLRPWLFTVARNLVIDGYRKDAARPHEVDGSIWLEQDVCEVDDIDRLLTSVVVTEAMGSLTHHHREALYHAYFLGRTVEETSHVLGVPVGTVKSRLYYGLRALRAAVTRNATETNTVQLRLGRGVHESQEQTAVAA
ncbi:sigma-70 family RNA polymerase sigma factor [Streptomyces sp. NPDC088560]|uniref:sigma-70 family RNA polymerase sigma factor n=1 Tax=Streptomyces sp. NPDC088560 TaxID=3365868 RepID=UPI0037FC062A